MAVVSISLKKLWGPHARFQVKTIFWYPVPLQEMHDSMVQGLFLKY